MTQTTLWLLPLLLGASIGIFNSIKSGIRWYWGVLIQHSLILILSVLGLWVIPRYDWLCAIAGWFLLLLFTVVARLLILKMGRALGLLRCQQVVSLARILQFLFWGPPGKYWLELAYMINFYLSGDAAAANKIYEKWANSDLPRNVADNLSSYSMVGLLLMQDWDGAIQKYEDARERYLNERKASRKPKKVRFPNQVASSAVRAFNERYRFKEALEALRLADLPGSNYGRDTLETVFLAYFALLGAAPEVQEIIDSMSKNRNALPEHARLYWQARCFARRYEYEAAIRTFAECVRKTPERDIVWKERAQKQMKLVQDELLKARDQVEENEPVELRLENEPVEERLENEPVELRLENEPDRLEAIKEGKGVLRKAILVSDIMASRQNPRAVNALTGVISISFVLTFVPMAMLMGMGDHFINFCQQAFLAGYLQGNLVLQGQWWRLISYMFIHGGLSHLMMNLFALVWFGRYVENLFGSRCLLIIFFASGVFSGLLEMLVTMDEPSVGASGAILGVFGAGLAATLRLKDVLPPAVRKHELLWMIALAVTQLLFDQLVNFFFPSGKHVQSTIRIAAAAHFGGMLSGFVLGWLLPLKILGTEKKKEGAKTPI